MLIDGRHTDTMTADELLGLAAEGWTHPDVQCAFASLAHQAEREGDAETARRLYAEAKRMCEADRKAMLRHGTPLRWVRR